MFSGFFYVLTSSKKVDIVLQNYFAIKSESEYSKGIAEI